MKKLLFALAIIAFALTAQAADVTFTWDHDGQNVDGFTLYFWQTNQPTTVYNKTVSDGAARSMLIAEYYFAQGIEYSFEMTAYNTYGESDRSNRLLWTRDGTPFSPPADSLPSVMYIRPTKPTVITIEVP